MANPWFRLYSEFADDPKVQMMSEAMQRRLLMLFCSRCKGETLHETEMAFHWRVTETDLQQTKAVFLEKGFIDDEWNVLNWNRRQYLSDISTERVRAYRDRKKQDETLQKQDETKTVTAPEQNRTETEQIQKHKNPLPRDEREVTKAIAAAAKKAVADEMAKKRKASQAKQPTKTDLARERHKEFKAAIASYWRSKNPDVEMPWGAPEGQALEIWLRECPNTTIEQFREMLRNRFRSDVNHTERPSVWIRYVSSYAVEPLNQYKNPKSLAVIGNTPAPKKTIYSDPEAFNA